MNSYRAQALFPSLPTHPHSYKKSACCFLSTCSSCYDVWHTYDIRILSWLCLGRGEGGVIWAFLIILQKYFLIKQWTYSVFVQNFISVGRVYMYLILFYKKKIHNMIVAHVQATVREENRFFVDENTFIESAWSIDGLIYLIIPEIDTFVIPLLYGQIQVTRNCVFLNSLELY